MIKQLLFLFGFLLIVMSCESGETEGEENPISEEHAALFGTWEEKDSTEKIIWEFERHELKWKGFTHFYEVSGDSLIISGLVYQITEQSEKKLKLLSLNGKPCTLNRKE